MPCGVRFSTGTADGGERCSGFGTNDSFHRADSTHGNNNTDRTDGDYVTATFSAARTRHITTLILQNSDLVKDYSYMEVQVLVDGKWETYLTDTDPYTTFNYQGASLNSIDDTATVGWLLEGENAVPGIYRLVYHGIAKTLSWGKVVYKPFTSVSRQFEVL